MSQYTYPYGYGQGQYSGPPVPPTPPHPHPQPQPFAYPPATTYPATSYNQSYEAHAGDLHRAASQNSFSYNANQIPGLGVGPPAPPVNSYGHAPGGWPQAPFAGGVPGLQQPPQASVANPPKGPPSGGVGSASAISNKTTAARPQERTTAPAKKQPSPPSNDMEEGELSEGQFEDLYEPTDHRQQSNSLREQQIPPSTVVPSPGTSAVDTPEASFYGNDDEGGEVSVKVNIEKASAREQSRSYSPFLSPREIRTENTTPRALAENEDDPSSPFLAPKQNAMLKAASRSDASSTQENGSASRPSVPGLQYASKQPADVSRNEHNTPPKEIPSGPQPSSSAPRVVSLQDLKKEAQKAILRLWPLGVKYQHYIDEGIDEKVIKNLFGDLHLDVPKQATDATKGPESQPGEASSHTAQLSTAPPLAASSNETASKPDKSAKGEERKDRIARLLAAKAAKPATAPITKPVADQQSPKPAHSQAQEQPAKPPTKPKAWGEKERLLQQKIAALEKAREAQKSATEQRSADAAVVANSNSTGADAMASQQNPSSRGDRINQDAIQQGGIPGLSLPLASQPNQLAAQRKRPVAADFVEYSSIAGPSKRPFGQDRKRTALIINVSDGSDDEDMDIEMDMESPIDEPSVSGANSFIHQGPSIRDFPPLTDNPPERQFPSPGRVSSSHTPPNGLKKIWRKETELDIKERAIQEMRRKIAEAEARRKAKRPSTGSQTPNLSSRTPELKEYEARRPQQDEENQGAPTDASPAQPRNNMSSRLPKRRDRSPVGQLVKAERRGRIVSFELPRIDESLEDKVRRLQQLRDEEAHLKSEIDKELAQKKMLTEELEQMDTSTDSGSQLNKPSSDSDSGPNSRIGSTSAEQNTTALNSPSGGSDHVTTEHGDGDSDISMDEDQSSRESSQDSVADREASESHDVVMGQMPGVDAESTSIVANGSSIAQPGETDSGHRDMAASEPAGSSHEDASSPSPSAGFEHAHAAPGEESRATGGDTTIAEPLVSRSAGSSPVDATTDHAMTDEDKERSLDDEELDQISGVTQPREDAQEIEAELAREVTHKVAPASGSAFQEYVSPLRYFHAYRFHPDFPKTVSGGLKSLTYSSRIDPKIPLCPYELGGQQCSVAGCEFQHFKSIIPQDDQILVELGSAEDYDGVQKSRFIQGLRELLQDFRVKKVKDFDTIAGGIIGYRARFLEDRSKILHLDGVTL